METGSCLSLGLGQDSAKALRAVLCVLYSEIWSRERHSRDIQNDVIVSDCQLSHQMYVRNLRRKESFSRIEYTEVHVVVS